MTKEPGTRDGRAFISDRYDESVKEGGQSPVERYLGSTPRIAWHDVYRVPGASAVYVNPALRGNGPDATWWPRHAPYGKRDLRRLSDGLALTVKPGGTYRPVGRLMAFDSGRCLLFPPLFFKGPSGRLYRDISIKGVGPIREFVGDNNRMNRWYACGTTSTLQSYVDLARSEILRAAGVHAPLGLAILDTGEELRQLHHDGRELQYRGAVYARAFSLNTRLHNLRDTEPEPLASYLSCELKHLSAVEGTDLTDPAVYIMWFARRLGLQAARMQRLGYLHGALHPQQLCIDGTLCDFEHEAGTGFNKDLPPWYTQHLPDFTFGDQPENFAGLIYHGDYDDALWHILRRADMGVLPSPRAVLDEYRETFRREYDTWEPPDIDNLVHSFGLDNEALLREAFSTTLVREDGPRLDYYFTIC